MSIDDFEIHNGRIYIRPQAGLTPQQARELAEQILVIAGKVEDQQWQATKRSLEEEGMLVWDVDIYGR